MTDRVTFECTDCRHPVMIDEDNPPKDDDVIACIGCGRTFGTYAQVKEAVIQMGKEEIDRLISSAGLPAWIRRTD